MHLNIIYLTNTLVNIIIHFITISSSNIQETDYLEYIQYTIINIIIIRSINIKEITYLDYIQYIVIYIINSNNNIKEIDCSDHIQLYIIIVIYFNSVIDPSYLHNIQNIIIITIIISSSNNINQIPLLFNIIDYIIDNLLTIIKNINTIVYDIKITNIIHMNYKHHIDIENIKTTNIINYNNINNTLNQIYLYIINIINSHTIIATDNIQYNITIYIFYVIIMAIELYQSISYILTNFYGFIIIVETGHPISDVNLILYINTKEKSYVIKLVLHHKDRHHHYIQNIDDIKGTHCILEDAFETSKMHQQSIQRASTRCTEETSAKELESIAWMQGIEATSRTSIRSSESP